MDVYQLKPNMWLRPSLVVAYFYLMWEIQYSALAMKVMKRRATQATVEHQIKCMSSGQLFMVWTLLQFMLIPCRLTKWGSEEQSRPHGKSSTNKCMHHQLMLQDVVHVINSITHSIWWTLKNIITSRNGSTMPQN